MISWLVKTNVNLHSKPSHVELYLSMQWLSVTPYLNLGACSLCAFSPDRDLLSHSNLLLCPQAQSHPMALASLWSFYTPGILDFLRQPVSSPSSMLLSTLLDAA